MKIIKTNIKDLLIVKQKNNIDHRGGLRETFNINRLNKKFVFEYCTTSKFNVLRGFHFQTKFQYLARRSMPPIIQIHIVFIANAKAMCESWSHAPIGD